MKRKIADKRQHIIDRCAHIFLDSGVRTPTAKIAKECGVSNGTLFNYFPTKQNLIDDVFCAIVDEYTEYFMKDFGEHEGTKASLFAIWQSYFTWAMNNPEKHQAWNLLLMSNVLTPETLQKGNSLFDPCCEMIAEASKNGELVDQSDVYITNVAAMQLLAALRFANSQELKGESLDRFIQESFDIYWKGIIR